MDSKLLRKAMLYVTLFVGLLLLIILLVNDRLGKKNVPVVENTDGEVTEYREAVDENGMIEGSDLYAWMGDETFFDAEKIGDGKYDVTTEIPVSLMASSVDKDLRVMILDEEGKLVKGRTFNINIAGLGDYTDNDKDGIIYVGDMKPGQYSIMLGHILGYTEPAEPLTVSVKAKIEYKAIADISYLIKTEEDIDPAKEDTAYNEAAEETTGNSAIKTVKGAVFGIDVSKYNGDINWEMVKNEGVKFAIIRCGYRGSQSGSIVVDPYFEKNIEGAKKAGIPIGIYFFTQATNDREAVEEASAVMSLIRKYDITYPVFVDSESAGGKGRADELGVTERSSAVQAFCETIRSGGYKAGVYASKNWFNNRLDISKLSADNVTWLAEYNDKPTYGATYQLWQYSSGGRINGIEGRVDMNISYLDVDGDSNNTTKEEKKDNKENEEDGQDRSRDM